MADWTLTSWGRHWSTVVGWRERRWGLRWMTGWYHLNIFSLVVNHFHKHAPSHTLSRKVRFAMLLPQLSYLLNKANYRVCSPNSVSSHVLSSSSTRCYCTANTSLPVEVNEYRPRRDANWSHTASRHKLDDQCKLQPCICVRPSMKSAASWRKLYLIAAQKKSIH